MEATFCIQPATNGGCGPWALSLMVAISKYSNVLSTEEIIAVFKCLVSLSNSTFISIPAIDFWLSFFLEYGSNPDICLEGLTALDKLLSKFKDNIGLLNEDNLKDILCCGRKSGVLSNDELFQCESILKYGLEGFQIEENNSYIFLPVMVKILKDKKLKN